MEISDGSAVIYDHNVMFADDDDCDGDVGVITGERLLAQNAPVKREAKFVDIVRPSSSESGKKLNCCGSKT